jgi:acetolactate synthase regulatory subunit
VVQFVSDPSTEAQRTKAYASIGAQDMEQNASLNGSQKGDKVKQDGDYTYTLSLLVRNQPGVLVRCAQVFNRRGHNIEALHVQANHGHETESIMTIRAYGRPSMMNQIVAQLQKLVDVISVTETEEK